MRLRVENVMEAGLARLSPARSVAATAISYEYVLAAMVASEPVAYCRGLFGVMVNIIPVASQLNATWPGSRVDDL
jgi:hypothetical protein